MSTSYTIVIAQVRPELNERINIGLILQCEGKVMFQYSAGKMRIVKDLLSAEAYRLLKETIRNISSATSENAQTAFWSRTEGSFEKLSYLDYLSRYSNNVVGFSSPKPIDLSLDNDVFTRLFQLMIDHHESVPLVTPKNRFTLGEFKLENKERLRQHYNIDFDVSSSHVPHLVVPVRTDFIGRNERPVFAIEVDLQKRLYDVTHEISRAFMLRDSFLNNSEQPQAFIVHSEPDKKQTEKHAIWKELKELPNFTSVDITESKKILAYAEEHGVRPLQEREE